MIISRISPISLAKNQAFIFIFLGLFSAIVFSFFSSLIISTLENTPLASSLSGLKLTIWPITIITFPIIFYIIGFILGIIEAGIYNLFTKFSRGLEVQTDKELLS